ncbi:MAG TPA: hypothetical protein VNW97_22515 [Candidatus Saccharimonadales bacterium]|jgi:hypothetical protein|nr:hypothetical protein [Candidatus Saccharimonadales bacterium]
MNHDAIKSTIQSLQYVYTVVLALSLGEAIRQVVADNVNDVGKIHWDRTLNLASFLLLIVPFLQGMNRYFFDIYLNPGPPNPYAGRLLVDGFVFTVESSLFFVLARSLPKVQWPRFNLTVVVLLALDAAWGFVTWRLHGGTVGKWVIYDILTLPLLLPILIFFKSKRDSWIGPILCVLTMLGRTILDYFCSWDFYFPGVRG